MATQPGLIDIEPVQSCEEAKDRAKQFKQLDPFPDIKPALLSGGDIKNSAQVHGDAFSFLRKPQFAEVCLL